MSANYCRDCQQLTSGKCWKHSQVTEAAQPVYGWVGPIVRRMNIQGNEYCSCGAEAAHKVEEDTPGLSYHPFTTYVCCECFGKLMGGVAKKWCANGHRFEVPGAEAAPV